MEFVDLPSGAPLGLGGLPFETAERELAEGGQTCEAVLDALLPAFTTEPVAGELATDAVHAARTSGRSSRCRAVPADAHALHWADGLLPQGAKTLAAYVHPHFGHWPAVTTHRHGAGRVTYVGTVPDPVFARALFDRYAPEGAWRPAHPSVTATSATARDGRRVRFLHNWSWEEVSVPVPTALRDVLSETVYGDAVPLGPWDVKVLLQEPVMTDS